MGAATQAEVSLVASLLSVEVTINATALAASVANINELQRATTAENYFVNGLSSEVFFWL